MFLKNYNPFLGLWFTNRSISSLITTAKSFYGTPGSTIASKMTSSNYEGANSCISMENLKARTPTYANMKDDYQSYSSSCDYGVVFGTGSTPPTVDDYTLSGTLITDLVMNTNVTYSSSVKTVDESITHTTVYTISNTTSNDITIGEIGMVLQVYSGEYKNKYTILIERSVLDEPITIPSGGVGQVTYVTDFSYPIIT